MRWKNKGHEYDDVYRRMEAKRGFYLFGCGDYGRQFLDCFQDEVSLIGYIDNDPTKQETGFNGRVCVGLDKVTLKEDEGIILTISQYDRAGAIKQLQKCGFRQYVEIRIVDIT